MSMLIVNCSESNDINDILQETIGWPGLPCSCHRNFAEDLALLNDQFPFFTDSVVTSGSCYQAANRQGVLVVFFSARTSKTPFGR